MSKMLEVSGLCMRFGGLLAVNQVALEVGEKQIVSMRFGLGGRQEKTQKEVADIMGISQSYISRLEKRIMVRLRREISRQICS